MQIKIHVKHAPIWGIRQYFILTIEESRIYNSNGVMVFFMRNGHGNTCSSPGNCYLHFTSLLFPWVRYESIYSISVNNFISFFGYCFRYPKYICSEFNNRDLWTGSLQSIFTRFNDEIYTLKLAKKKMLNQMMNNYCNRWVIAETPLIKKHKTINHITFDKLKTHFAFFSFSLRNNPVSFVKA